MSKSYESSSVEFLFTELQSGMTFAELVFSAKPGQPDKREVDTINARKAYDTILKFRSRTALSQDESKRLADGLEDLKEQLRKLGQAV
jgi:hypothetical protein